MKDRVSSPGAINSYKIRRIIECLSNNNKNLDSCTNDLNKLTRDQYQYLLEYIFKSNNLRLDPEQFKYFLRYTLDNRRIFGSFRGIDDIYFLISFSKYFNAYQIKTLWRFIIDNLKKTEEYTDIGIVLNLGDKFIQKNFNILSEIDDMETQKILITYLIHIQDTVRLQRCLRRFTKISEDTNSMVEIAYEIFKSDPEKILKNDEITAMFSSILKDRNCCIDLIFKTKNRTSNLEKLIVCFHRFIGLKDDKEFQLNLIKSILEIKHSNNYWIIKYLDKFPAINSDSQALKEIISYIFIKLINSGDYDLINSVDPEYIQSIRERYPVLNHLSEAEMINIFFIHHKFKFKYLRNYSTYIKKIYVNLFNVNHEFLYNTIIDNLKDAKSSYQITDIIYQIREFRENINATPTQKLTIVNALYEALCVIESSTTS